MSNVRYIHTNDSLTVVIKGQPFTVARDHKLFDEAVGLLRNGTEADFEDLLTRIQRKLAALNLTSGLKYSDGVITYNGEVVHNYAADRLIGMIEAGADYSPLAKFLDKLQANPSKRVVDNLYSFLEHGTIPLTVDGDFLAYKAVRANFMDIHSGTFFNGVGATCAMARNKVDEDPNRTCSNGLHVCSYDYLQHFAHADGHVMVCKINPADVVAIPADYDNTKMRVSKYVVVDEVQGYYKGAEASSNDVLGDIGRDTGVMAAKFEIFDPEGQLFGTSYTIEEARHLAKDAYDQHDDPDDSDAFVMDSEGLVVYEYDGE